MSNFVSHISKKYIVHCAHLRNTLYLYVSRSNEATTLSWAVGSGPIMVEVSKKVAIAQKVLHEELLTSISHDAVLILKSYYRCNEYAPRFFIGYDPLQTCLEETHFYLDAKPCCHQRRGKWKEICTFGQKNTPFNRKRCEHSSVEKKRTVSLRYPAIFSLFKLK